MKKEFGLETYDGSGLRQHRVELSQRQVVQTYHLEDLVFRNTLFASKAKLSFKVEVVVVRKFVKRLGELA